MYILLATLEYNKTLQAIPKNVTIEKTEVIILAWEGILAQALVSAMSITLGITE